MNYFIACCKKTLRMNTRIEKILPYRCRAQTGSAAGYAVVLQINNAALDKRDGNLPDGHPHSRAGQERRASPQERRCRPSRDRKAGRSGKVRRALWWKGREGNPFTLWTMMRPCATGWRPWW